MLFGRSFCAYVVRRWEGFLPRVSIHVVCLVGWFGGSLFLLERLDTVLTASRLRYSAVTNKADRIVAPEGSLHDRLNQDIKHGFP